MEAGVKTHKLTSISVEWASGLKPLFINKSSLMAYFYIGVLSFKHPITLGNKPSAFSLPVISGEIARTAK
jgi:hypothetical protein